MVSNSSYKSGVRQVIDDYLLAEAAKRRDYGDYWSASSAGYCFRKIIFDRLQVPEVNPDKRKQRIFTVGHIFHGWIQDLTKQAGASVAQEVELQDEDLMVRGHFDDLVLVGGPRLVETDVDTPAERKQWVDDPKHLILYDYKTQNSRAFSYQKEKPISHFHRLQLGTYVYIIRRLQQLSVKEAWLDSLPLLDESRILKISKDDLRMSETILPWEPNLEKDVVSFWRTLNGYWKSYLAKGTLPRCTCDKHEGGFMAREAYNPYFYGGEPCSQAWFELQLKEAKIKEVV